MYVLRTRVILFAYRSSSSVELFSKLGRLPFYEEAELCKCCIVYKRLCEKVPSYINRFVWLNNEIHSRRTRSSPFNLVCPTFNRKTEGWEKTDGLFIYLNNII